MNGTFLTAEWRKLIMVQYAVDPAVLTPYLPGGVELDLFQNRCYVSLVGFLFASVRVKGVAFPFHTQFEEINLRFYVRRTEADGSSRRGVVFIREFVPRRAIAFVAKHFYEEPYAALPTRHRIAANSESLNVTYDWEMDGHHSMSVEADAQAQPIAAGSEEEFITEHYWGFTKRSNGSTSQYEVQHPRWCVYPIRSYQVSADFAQLYGPAFAFLNGQAASSVLLAEGSSVAVLGGTKLP